ncbi:YveK family protein [Bacillus benzoevorans]|uniref:Capsular polysaccharide biosynthesis protein n=1 Tax=Bacillus benzoevorans TaxID=1456 RepID=A0A7X0HU21_9BACI|nr:Wzz/FepE/Etk N-terminal domain-containing protein [Bacillus benzoevorans]MBB6446838.1 capsular polysaccharide biosynthesis protein [Bacillus benzoevorans]
MDYSIDFRALFDRLRKKWLFIVSIVMFAMGLSAVVSFYFITPIYQASTQILVSRAAADSQPSQKDVEFNKDGDYVETYSVIMKSPYILNQVIDELDLHTTFKELNKTITITQEGESHVVTVNVEHEEVSQAEKIANEIAHVFQREVPQLIGIKNVTILSTAEEQRNPFPVKPNHILNIAGGLVAGLVLSVGSILLLHYFDHTIKTEQDVEGILGAVILGTVGDMEDEGPDSKLVQSRQIERRQLNV